MYRKPKASEGFCLSHRNAILIFDGHSEGEQLQNAHHEHFRMVCLALKDADIGLDVSGCILDSPNVIQAGFQLDRLSRGSVLVIDLMGQEDDEDSDLDDMATLEGVTPRHKVKLQLCLDSQDLVFRYHYSSWSLLSSSGTKAQATET